MYKIIIWAFLNHRDRSQGAVQYLFNYMFNVRESVFVHVPRCSSLRWMWYVGYGPSLGKLSSLTMLSGEMRTLYTGREESPGSPTHIPPISPASTHHYKATPPPSFYFVGLSLFLFLFFFVFFCCPPTARQPNENKGINVARKQLHLTSISIPRHAAAQMNLCLKCLCLATSHCLADSIHSLQPHPAGPGLISRTALLQHT